MFLKPQGLEASVVVGNWHKVNFALIADILTVNKKIKCKFAYLLRSNNKITYVLVPFKILAYTFYWLPNQLDNGNSI